MDIRLHILEKITNGFSVGSRIGRGGYGDVYKGVYNGEMIAVKLLHVDMVQGLDDQQFKNEVGNLLRLKHPNVVRLLGYCYETRSKYVEHNGENVFGKYIYRVLCFEYLQGGSLDMHLHAPSLAPNWSTRYNIIKGVCEGLNFLHSCEPPIFHLDIKPANILLDSSMDSKLADLGLSRLFTRSHTHVTKRIVGTQKYMPPEFMKHGIISSKNDVFSLGVVIIEIVTGPKGYSDYSEMGGGTQFMQEVLTNWSTVIEPTWKYRSEEILQVKTCIELALRCVDSERDNRPTVADILDALSKTETHILKRKKSELGGALAAESQQRATAMGFCRLESRGDGFFVLTMASIDGHNYLNEEAISDLVEDLEKVRNSAEAKGLVTTCEGGTFCAGLDYDHHAESEEQAEDLARRVAEVIRLLLELPVPTVAAVRGNATSLGLALALAHDHCFLWDYAVLGLPEARRGRRLPDYMATLLRDKLSYARLRKLLMLKSQTCTGKELAGTWWSTHGAHGDRRVVLGKAIDLLYDIQVGDGTNFAKTRQMLCPETCAAVGITMEKHKPRPTPAELASDKAAERSGTSVSRERDDPKRQSHARFGNMFKSV